MFGLCLSFFLFFFPMYIPTQSIPTYSCLLPGTLCGRPRALRRQRQWPLEDRAGHPRAPLWAAHCKAPWQRRWPLRPGRAPSPGRLGTRTRPGRLCGCPVFALHAEFASMVSVDAEQELYRKLFNDWGITPITFTQRSFMTDFYTRELSLGAQNEAGWELKG